MMFVLPDFLNLIVIAIENRIMRSEMETLQFVTHPYLTPSPIANPVINAAMNAANNV